MSIELLFIVEFFPAQEVVACFIFVAPAEPVNGNYPSSGSTNALSVCVMNNVNRSAKLHKSDCDRTTLHPNQFRSVC